MQKDQNSLPHLDLTLLETEYSPYQYSAEAYLLAKIETHNPWPHHNLLRIRTFLQQLAALYHPIPYHNLTHAFDVMVNLDQYLTRYGWQARLAIAPEKTIFMLFAAYAHDSGHQGLSNAFYKNSKHPLAMSDSPLQTMHVSNLMRVLAQNQLEIDAPTKQELTEMILKTDNFYHFQLIAAAKLLEGLSNDELRQPKQRLLVQCLLLHAADLNNTAKTTELALRWTGRLYQQFQYQDKLERERGLPLTYILGSEEERVRSSISFLEHLALPLFRSIANIQPLFEQLVAKVQNNKEYYQFCLQKFK